MTDPLSAIAAVLTILDAASETRRILKTVVMLKNAPNEPLALNNEVNDLTIVVQDIRDLLDRSVESSQVQASQSICKYFEDAKATLLELEALIVYSLTKIDTKTDQRKPDLPGWMQAKRKIQNLKDKIQKGKVGLVLALAQLNLYVSSGSCAGLGC